MNDARNTTLTFGMLPTEPVNPTSLITSSACNLSIMIGLFLIGAAAHRIDRPKYIATPLYMPPIAETAPPPIHLKAPVLPPVAPVALPLASVALAAPQIHVQRRDPIPDIRPLVLPETQAPVIQVSTRSPEIVLAPQPKAAFALATAHSAAQTVGVVGASTFGARQAQGSQEGQHVGSAGFGSLQSGRNGGAGGQVVARAGIPARVEVSHTQTAPVASVTDYQAMRVISGPKPEYTEEAKKMGIEGSVVLRVTVGATGQISVLAVLHSLGHGLDEAAKRAVARYNIKPAARSGVPVEETTTITVTFQIA